MAHRLIYQVVVTGTQVFAKAFGQAYKQAATAQAASKTSKSSASKFGGLQLDEACKILDVDETALDQVVAELHKKHKLEDIAEAESVLAQLDKKFTHLYTVNSEAKSGSFYLQSKVYRAMERIRGELELDPLPKPEVEEPKKKEAEEKK